MSWKYIEYEYPYPVLINKILAWADKNFNCYFALKLNIEDSWSYYAGTVAHALLSGKLLTNYAFVEASAQTNYLTTVRDTSTGQVLAILPLNKQAKYVRMYVEEGLTTQMHEFRPSVYFVANEIVSGTIEITDELSSAPKVKIKIGVDTYGILGNLNGFYGITSDYYGLGLGKSDLTGNYLLYDHNSGTLRISGAISAGTIDIGGADATSFHVDADGNMWLGAATYNIATNPFAVSNAGLIRAVSGAIGGWSLAATTLTGTGITLSSTGDAYLAIGTTPPTAVTTGTGIFANKTGLFGLDANTQRFKLGTDGSGWLGASTTLAWTTAGVVTAGGWTINNLALFKDTGTDATSAGMAPGDVPFYAGMEYAHRATAPFNVTSAGSFTATSGYIGGTSNGWQITAGLLTAIGTGIIQTSTSANTGIKIDSTSLRGYNGSVQTVNIATDGSGWLGVTGTKQIQWTTAGVVNVAGFYAGQYDFWGGNAAIGNVATTIVLGNLDGTSKITLGATADAVTETLNPGVYMDGAGKFRAGTATAGTNFFWFDGTNISWKGTNTSLTAAGAFTASSATITGAINATSGKIGTATDYWSIGATGITATSGSTDVIINYGKTDFTNVQTGFILGYDFSASKAKFYIGDATSYLNWDGAALTYTKGTLIETIIQMYTSVASLATSATAGDGSASSAGMKVTYEGLFGCGANQTATIAAANANVRILATGAAFFSGTITASAGAIGGFTLSATALYAGAVATRIQLDTTSGIHLGATAFADAPFRVSLAGALVATSATITGAITASSGSVGSFTIGTYLYTGTKTAYNDANAGVHLGSDGIGIANNLFTVSAAGAMVAKSATIGNWTVNTTSIYTGTEDHSGYTANAGDITIYSDGADASIHAKNFYIDTAGSITATSATITGVINADTGYIGGASGWVISAGYIKDVAGVVGLSAIVSAGDDIRFWAGHATPASAPFYVTEAGVLKATSGAVGGWSLAATYIYYDGAADANSAGMALTDYPFYAGKKYADRATAPFRVTPAGALVATSATITGSVTATSGEIGGFHIAADNIHDAADTFGLASTVAGAGDIRFWAGDEFAHRASAPFRVTKEGALVASNATITGTINATAGYLQTLTLGKTGVASGTLTLQMLATGGDTYIAAGKTDFTNADAGFILGLDDSDSDRAKFYLGDSDNYFYFDGDYVYTNFKQLSFSQTAAPAVGSFAATVTGIGNINAGTSRYVITYVTAVGETEPSASVSAISFEMKRVGLSNIPVGGAKVLDRKIYRSLTTSTAYYFVAALGDNTTTTYDDNISDATIETQGLMSHTNTTGGIFSLGADICGSFMATSVCLGVNSRVSPSSICIGRNSGRYQQSSAGNNVFIGDYSGQGNSLSVGTAQESVFIGAQSGSWISTGLQNVCVGAQSGLVLSTGSCNVFLGHAAGRDSSSTFNNVFIGWMAGGDGSLTSTASDNVLIGYNAGYRCTAGPNTVVGASAGGVSFTNVHGCVLFGYAQESTESHVLKIGHGTVPTIYGKTDTYNVAIGLEVTFGTSLQKGLAFPLGTAPSAVMADAVMLWSEDINAEAGHNGLHMMGEFAAYKMIVPGVYIKTDTGNPAADFEGMICINTYDNNIKLYGDGGWRQLATW
jgi:hypothetical protein